jgi:hypothetical protein
MGIGEYEGNVCRVRLVLGSARHRARQKGLGVGVSDELDCCWLLLVVVSWWW